MASINLDKHSGRFRVRFRLNGQEFNRSIKTRNRKEAIAQLVSRWRESFVGSRRGIQQQIKTDHQKILRISHPRSLRNRAISQPGESA